MRANKFLGIGRVAREPRFTPAKGETQARLQFNLIINRVKSEEYDPIPITVWGKYAETLSSMVRKGKELAVEGSIRTNSVQDAAGNWTNYWEIRADSISLGVDSKKTQEERAAAANSVDALADKLAEAAKKPAPKKSQLDELVAALVKKGLTKTKALSTAKAYLAEKAAQTTKSATADTPPADDSDPFAS